jgi:hypothetical protein
MSDPLSAAKGILAGLGLGLAFWLLTVLVFCL